MLDIFINLLIINPNNEQNYGLALKTTVDRETFYVYKNKDDKILIQPKKGEGQFRISRQAIENYLISSDIKSNNDLSYIQPIGEYINKYIKG